MNTPSGSTPLLVLLSAPSGAGKTTLGQELLAARPGFTRAVTCTTRQPRPGERHGVDYFFLDPATFRQRLEAGEFLEHAKVYENYYGTLKVEVAGRLQRGLDVLLTVDVQGARSIQAIAAADPIMGPALVSVFLTPQTLSELEQRLKKRNQNDPADLAKRLAEAKRELSCWKDFAYLLISTTIPEDLRRMLAIVDAERMRQARAHPPES